MAKTNKYLIGLITMILASQAYGVTFYAGVGGNFDSAKFTTDTQYSGTQGTTITPGSRSDTAGPVENKLTPAIALGLSDRWENNFYLAAELSASTGGSKYSYTNSQKELISTGEYQSYSLTSNFDIKTKFSGSFNIKPGFFIMPYALIYGQVGVCLTSIDLKQNLTVIGFSDYSPPKTSFSGDFNKSISPITANIGAGVDIFITKKLAIQAGLTLSTAIKSNTYDNSIFFSEPGTTPTAVNLNQKNSLKFSNMSLFAGAVYHLDDITPSDGPALLAD